MFSTNIFFVFEIRSAAKIIYIFMLQVRRYIVDRYAECKQTVRKILEGLKTYTFYGYNAPKRSVYRKARSKLETTEQIRSFTIYSIQSINQYFYVYTVPTVYPKCDSIWPLISLSPVRLAGFVFLTGRYFLIESTSRLRRRFWEDCTTRASPAQAYDGSLSRGFRVLVVLGGPGFERSSGR